MKTFKSTLVVIMAAFALLASLAVSTSAAPLVSAAPGGTIAGTLNAWDEANGVAITPQPTSYDTGSVARLQANFSGSPGTITLYKEGPADTWTSVGSQAANSNGNAYFDYTVTSGSQRLYAETAGALETEIDTITGNAVVPQDGVLNAPTNSGKNWTADFTPGIAGKATQLQIQRIYTDETDEVNAVNPAASKTKKMGEWVTIATANQNGAGHVVFPTLSSPYPYRVAHKYRAVSGAAKTCDPVDASVIACQTFGITNPAPYDTGLSKVYFNSNEGHAIDTRTRYYEGEFSMTADSKGLGCGAVPTTKFSVMKGRGNYSWSFKRKSYTLKLGSSIDLCGMGANKKYALVSQDYDKSFLRNALAGYIGKKFTKMLWTPDSKPVDLYLNGKYLGNYLLIERIAIAADRVNIPELKGGAKATDQGACQGAATPDNQTTDPNHPNNIDPCKTGGYILEWDFRKGADYNAYLGSDSGYVGVKDPENDLNREGGVTTKGISSQQKSYISSYLNTVDSNLRGSGFTNDTTGWKKYIDEASAVDYYIAMEYMKPVDGNMWASVYMYKQRDSSAGANDGKLYFGPMWDFDLAAGSATRAGNVVSPSSFYLRNNLGVSAQQDTTSGKTWFNRLNEDSDFRTAVHNRWNAIKGSLTSGASDGGIPGFLNDQSSIIATSAATSYSSGPSSHSYRISDYQVIKSSWSADVSYLKSWANSRTSWLSGSSGF